MVSKVLSNENPSLADPKKDILALDTEVLDSFERKMM